MNDLYNETVVRNGKTYHYDPDRDIYYPRYAPMSTWDKWSPVIVIIVLSAIAVYVEFYHNA
jgi:hypothetical protein